MEQFVADYGRYMESFFRHSLDTISIIGRDGLIQYVNPAFERLYGLSARAVIGRSIWSLWPENHADKDEIVTRLQREGVTEYEICRANTAGKEVYVSLTVTPIKDSANETISYLTVGRDVTEQKRMERSLQEVNALFTMIEENMSDIVSILDSSGVVQYASKSHETLLGVQPDSIAGSPANTQVHPDDLVTARSTFQHLLQHKTHQHMECRLRQRNGEWVPVEIVMTPVLNHANEVSQVVVVSRDISERRRTDQLLMHAEKLSVVGKLGAAFAHEIRNPLTAIKGFLQLMSEKGQYDEEYIRIILSEIHRIEGITTEFLNSAKPQVSQYHACDIQAILRRAVSVMQPEAHMHNIQIETRFSGEELLVWGHPHNIQQVFMNVLKNAVESMSKGGIVVANVRRIKDAVCIEIIDQGCGIPPHIADQLGIPFYTTKEKGTGLGLTVSSKILHEHHASIQFVNSRHQGTTVLITFPLHPSHKVKIDHSQH